MKLVVQSLVLILSFIIVFAWQQTFFSTYTVPVIGFLIFLYLFLSARKRGKGFLTLGGEGPWGIFALNTLVLLLVFSTGAINSPIFFLLYFLGFGIAFVFEPLVVFVFVVGVILLFFQEALETDMAINLIKLGSLLLISPLAFFFGNEYRLSDRQSAKLEALKERSKDAGEIIAKDVEEVLEEEKGVLDEKTTEKLDEILEEAEELRQEEKEPEA